MKHEAALVVTSTAKGFSKSAGHCVHSVRGQTFTDFVHIFVGVDEMAQRVASTLAGSDDRFDIIGPTAPNAPVLANLLPIWRRLPPETIVVWLDGDDWFAHDRALERVYHAHRRGAWVTYGQFIWGDGRLGFAAPVGDYPRKEPWRATHLRTFRAGLVQRMRDEDFRMPDGEYAGLAADQRVMLGCLELAGRARSAFIPEVLCVYNHWNSFGIRASEDELAQERVEVERVRAFASYVRTEHL